MVEKGTCNIFGRHGHKEARCYEVIGCPLSWGSHGRGEVTVAAEIIEELVEAHSTEATVEK